MDEDSKPPEEGFYLRSNRLGMKLQSITEIIIEDSWKEKKCEDHSTFNYSYLPVKDSPFPL